MAAERVVRKEDGEKLAKVKYDAPTLLCTQRYTPHPFSSNVFPFQEYGVPFMETSAKTGANVELAFLAIAK